VQRILEVPGLGLTGLPVFVKLSKFAKIDREIPVNGWSSGFSRLKSPTIPLASNFSGSMEFLL
jgi:hypothetical protein